MTVLARRLMAALAGIGALWIITVSVIGFGAEMLFGLSVAERFAPFSNAHLLEEAFEGTYSPIADPAFVIHALAIACLVFGAFTFYLARGPLRERYLYAAAPAALAIGVLGWHWSFSWENGYPDLMRWGVIFELAAYFIASAGALFLAAFHRGKRVGYDG